MATSSWQSLRGLDDAGRHAEVTPLAAVAGNRRVALPESCCKAASSDELADLLGSSNGNSIWTLLPSPSASSRVSQVPRVQNSKVQLVRADFYTQAQLFDPWTGGLTRKNVVPNWFSDGPWLNSNLRGRF